MKVKKTRLKTDGSEDKGQDLASTKQKQRLMATQSYVSNLSESADHEDRYAGADGDYPLKTLEEGGDEQMAQGRKVDHLYADVSCWCVPSCVSGPGDFCGRFGNWMLLNSDQFISSIVGESSGRI